MMNNLSFNTSEEEQAYVSATTAADLLGPEYHRFLRIFIIAGMIVFSLIGNCLVCYRLSRNRRSRKGQALFLNLAIADLLVTCFTMTSQLIWEIMGRQWIAGDAFCRIFKVLQTLGLVGSTYMLVAIAIDRYFALVKPLSIGPKPWKLALSAWIASVLPSFPNVYIFREVRVQPNLSYCTSIFYANPELLPRQIYMALVFTSIFIIPFLLLVAFYTRILIEMSRQTSNFLSRSFTSIPRAKLKTFKLALVIFSAFMVTNVPYVIQEMILAFGDPTKLDQNMVALFGVISASNSALNPIIYLTFHSKWNCWRCCRSVLSRTPLRSENRQPKTVTFSSSWQGSRRISQVRSGTAGSRCERLRLTRTRSS